MKEINLALPYFDCAGTIGKITTDLENKCYIKHEYDGNGNLEKIGKPVCKKKLDDLMDNYFQDVLEYLNANASKINTYQSTRLKKKINLKSLYMDIIGASILSFIGLGLTILSLQIATIAWPFIISLLITITAGTYLGVKVAEKRTYDQDVKKSNSIKTYKTLQKALNEHNLQKEKKHIPTKYQGLTQGNINGNSLKRTRARILETEK